MGLFHTGIPLRAASGWWVDEGYPLSWSGRAGWLGSPSSRVPMVCCHLGNFGSMIQSVGSPLLIAAQASVTSRMSATAAEGMAHPLHFVLQQCCGCQGPLVGIYYYGQSFLAGVSLHIHEPVISGTVPGIEFGLGVKPGDGGWAPSQFLPWQHREPLSLEVLFDRVQDLLEITCLHLLVTDHPPWQPP